MSTSSRPASRTSVRSVSTARTGRPGPGRSGGDGVPGRTGTRPEGVSRPGRPLAYGPVLAVVAVGLLATVVAAAFSGAAAAPPVGINDAGAVVRWALPAVRVVHDVTASLTFGALLLVGALVPRWRGAGALDDPRVAQGLRLAMLSGFVWALAGLVGVVLGFSDAAALPPGHPAFASELMASVWSLEALRVGIISAGCAFVVATGCALARSRWAALGLAAVALFGILVLGLAGHAGGSADHETAVNALGAHLLSAATWVGGLLALLVLRPTLGPTLAVVARRYSSLALWSFVTLGVSGVMVASTRLAGLSDLTTDYGILVVVKVLAFVALGVAGWWHRRSTLTAMETGAGAGGSRLGRPFVRLALGEGVVMALAFGVAAALARSAPPVPETTADPTAALALTGFPAPDAPTALSWVTAWRVEWLFLATGLLAIGLYLAGVVRLHRRGDRWPVGRTVNWVVGWLVFLYATNGALGIYGRVAFSWHMTLHMVEAMVVPIFLVLGAPVTLALRALAARKDGSVGPREIVLRVVHSKVFAVAGNPIFAAVFFFASLVAFYWTGLFELALTTHTGHLLMTAHFVLAGYLFAWVLVGVDPGPKRWSPALRLIVLFATIAFHAFFGVAMISGTDVIAPDFFRTIDIAWVPDLLADQRNGGSVAWAIGELPALALALVVAAQWFRSDRAEGVRRDRRADRDGDAELNEYNERLARMAGRRDDA
ncbi:bifunctional copper resistance protein CopD/cytochrome c oxidase assembly protein [Terracoccus luteus]|uniref:Putative copper resistance protein D n=1 Tax=Terracoccus luteus TaxID=53356 RepID=A0A839PTI2_9MICO|nr:bifunctional copper resistance protein CopD/cytochrome c oxidase assembly protein [Terracoccus luteus]MBB2986469.1 putative copper resistance protein D [Terracoccus luteus]MCP2171942.1 putative copper resistance protein D [Terracoccus luteus]